VLAKKQLAQALFTCGGVISNLAILPTGAFMSDTDDLTHKLLKLFGITRAGAGRGSARSKGTSEEELIVTDGIEAYDAKAAQPKYELLAMYGFSAKYPDNARLELNPKTRREKGDVVFHLEKGFKVFLSWGSLEEARKRYATAAAQASSSIERSVKSTRAKLDGTPETRNLKIQGHDAAYTHARMFVDRGGFPFGSRRVTQDSYSLHLQCDESGRYYVVYTFARPETAEELGKIFEPIMLSLKCHAP
jgi:hypothetical protein